MFLESLRQVSNRFAPSTTRLRVIESLWRFFESSTTAQGVFQQSKENGSTNGSCECCPSPAPTSGSSLILAGAELIKHFLVPLNWDANNKIRCKRGGVSDCSGFFHSTSAM